jgi:hypothetical protein
MLSSPTTLGENENTTIANLISLELTLSFLLGSSCAQHGLPEPETVPARPEPISVDAYAELSINNMEMMSPEQHAATDVIIRAVLAVEGGEPDRTRTFFLDGPGGSGKTFCYNTIIASLRARSLKVRD